MTPDPTTFSRVMARELYRERRRLPAWVRDAALCTVAGVLAVVVLMIGGV